MDFGIINWIIWGGIIIYANYKVYCWAQSLNPYDFSNKSK